MEVVPSAPAGIRVERLSGGPRALDVSLRVQIVVSPYHLTSKEPAALASLLLADRVVTMLPEPARLDGEGDLRRAVRSAPGYGSLLDAWEWMSPLWRAGLVAGEHAGDSPIEEVRRAFRAVREDERFEGLRAFVDVDRFAGDARSLEALSRDLLRAGPDPAMTIPLASGLDAFAVRLGLLVARSGAISLAQRAEAGLARARFAVAVPAIVQGEASAIGAARAMLDTERRALSAAMARAMEDGDDARVRAAGEAFARALERHRDGIVASQSADAPRVRIETLTIRGVLLPADAVLRSSLLAAERFSRAPGSRAARRTSGSATELAVREPGALVRSLVISPIVRAG